MKLRGPDTYQLTIRDRAVCVTARGGTAHFVAPATTRGMGKLYTVSRDGALLYVGVTSQSMSVRLRYGLTADGQNGYHGYSWGKKNHVVHLQLWYLDGGTSANLDLETIEAEVVFLYRQKSGQWPEDQTEIHFHRSDKAHRDCAWQIVEALKDQESANTASHGTLAISRP